MIASFLELNAKEIDQLERGKTAFLFSVGAIEDHGPHLPVGLDLLEAKRICALLANKIDSEMSGWNVIFMPDFALSVDSNTSKLNLNVRPHVLRDCLIDSSKHLIQEGFQYFICVTGNSSAKQLTAIEEAGKSLNRWISFRGGKNRPILVSFNSALSTVNDFLKEPFFSDPLEHGGKRDTSVALSIDEKKVNPIFKSLPEKKRESSWIIRLFKRLSKTQSGYWGSPAQAKKEEGEKMIEEMVSSVFPKIRAVLEGARPVSQFRSWHSLWPLNKTYFRAWILFFLILILMAAWVWITLKHFPGL